MLRGGGQFKLFSAGRGFTGQIFTEEFPGVDSARALRQAIRMFGDFLPQLWDPLQLLLIQF